MITTSTKKLFLIASGLLLGMACSLMPVDAFANGGQDLATQAKTVSVQLANVPRLIAMTCYVLGTFFAARSLFSLKAYIEKPDDNPLATVLAFACVAVLLILLPWILSVGMRTLGAHNVAVQSSAASFESKGPWSEKCAVDGTFSSIFCSLGTEFRYIPKTLVLMSYASGVLLFFIGLLNLRAHGDDPSQTPLRDILMKFVLGAFLISLPLAMEVVVKSVTGSTMANTAGATSVRRPCLAHGSALDPSLTSVACK